MTTTAPVPVTTAAFEDAAMIGRVLADAFFDDPVGHWLDPDPATRTGHLTRLFELWATAFTLPHGEVVCCYATCPASAASSVAAPRCCYEAITVSSATTHASPTGISR
jgi:hypothetical protein